MIIDNLAFELHASATDDQVWEGLNLQRRAVGDARDDLSALADTAPREVIRIYARIVASEVHVYRIYRAEARYRGLINMREE